MKHRSKRGRALRRRYSHARSNTIAYTRRGDVERGTGRGYVWREGYSETLPGGGVTYPWLTKTEARADAKRRGAKAVFLEK
jgi:hypothetical protein